MKLIELLARELKEWPEHATHAVQDGDGAIKFGAGADPTHDGEMWFRDTEIHHEVFNGFSPSSLVDDHSTAIIARKMWEAAVGERLTRPTPTLETMLVEWRDLEARAQAAQAEADALFEHAGQCHGEIVVRLAELGWSAPRGRVEPVVTLDDSDGWIKWEGGQCPLPSWNRVDIKMDDGYVYENGEGETADVWSWSHGDGPNIIAYRLTPSAQQ